MMGEKRASICRRLVANLQANLWHFIAIRERAKVAVAESQQGCECVKYCKTSLHFTKFTVAFINVGAAPRNLLGMHADAPWNLILKHARFTRYLHSQAKGVRELIASSFISQSG